MNELKELMRDNVAAPPPDHLDLDALLGAGHRRVRRRRAALVGGISLVAVGAVAAALVGLGGGASPKATADTPPEPEAPTIRLSDASRAVDGTDFQVLASHTNQNLDRANGQYFDGVTDDGLILYREGPHGPRNLESWGLLDPATKDVDWLPDPGLDGNQAFPVLLGADRLVLATMEGGLEGDLAVHVFDRASRQWHTVSWPELPQVGSPAAQLGPDGRLYVDTPATQGKPPPGGWPTDSEGDAEDADAEGDSFHLWSVSLTDGSDVRDEGITVGDFAFTDGSMVWTDRTNGDAGRVHVRDLASGEEHSFDPRAGDRCNLLSFGATDDRIVMSEYCGTYAGGVRDDRVQILTTEGDQVVTLQDSGVEGVLAGRGGTSDVVTMDCYMPDHEGTYVYDLATDRLLRLSDAVSKFGVGGTVPDGMFMWNTPVNHRHGQTQWLGRLLR